MMTFYSFCVCSIDVFVNKLSFVKVCVLDCSVLWDWAQLRGNSKGWCRFENRFPPKENRSFYGRNPDFCVSNQSDSVGELKRNKFASNSTEVGLVTTVCPSWVSDHILSLVSHNSMSFTSLVSHNSVSFIGEHSVSFISHQSFDHLSTSVTTLCLLSVTTVWLLPVTSHSESLISHYSVSVINSYHSESLISHYSVSVITSYHSVSVISHYSVGYQSPVSGC